MRPPENRLLLAVLAIGLGGLLWLTVAVLLLWLVLPDDQWSALLEAQADRGGLIVLLWLATLYPLSMALKSLINRHVTGSDRLLEQARAVVDQDHRLDPESWEHPPQKELARVINQLIDQREGLKQDMDQRVRSLSRRSELEKSRLAALMSELDKSVVVCNLEGKILLYNPRARLQFKRLSAAGGVTQGAELMGLGRSIHTVIDRELIDHALNKVSRRLNRGVSNPSSQFVTSTASGTLFRGLVSPVCDVDDQGQRNPDKVTGFVLLMENITKDVVAHKRKDELLRQLTHEGHAKLESSREALDRWQPDGDTSAATRQLIETLGAQIDQLSAKLEQAAAVNAQHGRGHWPMEDMRAEDWLEASLERLDQSDGPNATLVTPEEPLWLQIDSHSLMQVILSLFEMLGKQSGVDEVAVELKSHNDQALVDLSLPWPREQSLPELGPWLDQRLCTANGLAAGCAREILRRHAGECWIDRTGQQRAAVRLLLPTIQAQDEMPSRVAGERPEFFDFDLFARTSDSASGEGAFDDRPLSELSYTVFDLETTGLNPAAGDEIIQVGAVRVVNGRILPQESFDQLVDPQRGIPTLGIQIHGITPDQVRGQPTIDEVLPAFHAYCSDSVLVAHNAAFDMRCLTLKQDAMDLKFDQPVLDTLLLASLAQPHQASHSLDALAERFGLVFQGRHTGLGDATVTAELLIRLIPLLADIGIHTLADAQAASAQSYFARVQY
ncbi:MAG: exonuclease domain-containing protein [Pseudomonadota bacterium]